jgi:hypothetical protein
MLEVMRWISLGTSAFALCFSLFSLWLSTKRYKGLFYENLNLCIENAELRELCDSYWNEIVELRERIHDEG